MPRRRAGGFALGVAVLALLLTAVPGAGPAQQRGGVGADGRAAPAMRPAGALVVDRGGSVQEPAGGRPAAWAGPGKAGSRGDAAVEGPAVAEVRPPAAVVPPGAVEPPVRAEPGVSGADALRQPDVTGEPRAVTTPAETFRSAPDGQGPGRAEPAAASDRTVGQPWSTVRVTRYDEPVRPGSRPTVTVRVQAPRPGHLWVYLDRLHDGALGRQWANGPLPGLTASVDQPCDAFTDTEGIGIGTGFRCSTPAGTWELTIRVRVPRKTRPGSVAYFDAYHGMGSSLWSTGGMSGGFVVGHR